MNNVLYDWPLNEEQFDLFKQQYQKYLEIGNDSEINNSGYAIDDSGLLLLEEGTLLHGTEYNEENLISISQNGILACEFLGMAEDAETFYCADFYRVPKTQTMSEYSAFCMEREIHSGVSFQRIERSRLPITPKMEGHALLGSPGIAFIVNNTSQLQPLLQYDAYRENGENSKKVREIVNWEAVKDNARFAKERLSAVLVGIPSNALSGILIGDRIKEDTEKIEFLKEQFPSCYITTIDGKILYTPQYGYYEEKTGTKRGR